MRFTIAFAAALLAGTVSAHTRVIDVWVNGVDQGDGRGKYIRSPDTNSPVKDLALPSIVCNAKGGQAVSSFVSAAAGDTIDVEWYHDNRGDDIVDGSHLGPIITYIAKYAEGDGTGPVWSKIAEEGYDGTTWAVTKLIKNKGKAQFQIPSALAAGKYLIRQEIIALHESDTRFDQNSARGAQFYPSCMQFDITGSGSAVPDTNFDFNTGYLYTDAGIHFNLYSSFTSYKIPGPKIWSAAGGGGGSNPPPPTTTRRPTTSTVAPIKSFTTSTRAATASPVTTSTRNGTTQPTGNPSCNGHRRKPHRNARD
jgi:lytic cellulose monooxygenase (C1-hydroxylating)